MAANALQTVIFLTDTTLTAARHSNYISLRQPPDGMTLAKNPGPWLFRNTCRWSQANVGCARPTNKQKKPGPASDPACLLPGQNPKKHP